MPLFKITRTKANIIAMPKLPVRKVLLIITLTAILLLSGCLKQNPYDENVIKPTKGQQRNLTEASTDYVDVNKLGSLFGFTNETGRMIISPKQEDVIINVNQINKAIGENGNILSVKYTKNQVGTMSDNGRHTADNFNNMSGYIFEVVEGKAKKNETYYLINDKEFNMKSVLKSQIGDYNEINIKDRQELENIKNRKVHSTWKLGKIETDIDVYLILFERQNDDMLASIVIKTPSKTIYKDYPAKYNKESTWRVGDDSSISPDMFSILFAARAENGIVLGLKWIAQEGESISILKENGHLLEELNIRNGRYMLPI